MLRERPQSVELLILGAGWTSTFLIPQLDKEDISHAETTTTGRDGTIPFKFDPDSGDVEPYKTLPSASTVLVVFPLLGHGQSKTIQQLYRHAHGQDNHWIQLGQTGIFNVDKGWNNDDANYDTSDSRAVAEDELRELHGEVLCLSGLYGGERKPKNWVPRIAKNKEDVRKRSCVHFVHGEDVARAIIAAHKKPTPGKRWIVSDMRVYDWYDLILSFSTLTEEEEEVLSDEAKTQKLQFARWVGELMVEEGVRALPRSAESFERRLDSRGFWKEHDVWPAHPRLG
ncbi:hypothetical protein BDV96DRAFT_12838 [Lophiotrema nucula]|uniref:NAD(P)-binding domain-containing protein n=1 Tax=Lophiotrema nucula TaxID=690887 RepID=A0A6A5ZTI5_9PLEO|nr:hypothetical protein BDV96DRAFT_12838 [Lophiotrema nucula]